VFATSAVNHLPETQEPGNHPIKNAKLVEGELFALFCLAFEFMYVYIGRIISAEPSTHFITAFPLGSCKCSSLSSPSRQFNTHRSAQRPRIAQ
jgi:hypothetical protein